MHICIDFVLSWYYAIGVLGMEIMSKQVRHVYLFMMSTRIRFRLKHYVADCETHLSLRFTYVLVQMKMQISVRFENAMPLSLFIQIVLLCLWCHKMYLDPKVQTYRINFRLIRHIYSRCRCKLNQSLSLIVQCYFFFMIFLLFSIVFRPSIYLFYDYYCYEIELQHCRVRHNNKTNKYCRKKNEVDGKTRRRKPMQSKMMKQSWLDNMNWM